MALSHVFHQQFSIYSNIVGGDKRRFRERKHQDTMGFREKLRTFQEKVGIYQEAFLDIWTIYYDGVEGKVSNLRWFRFRG